MWFSLRFFSWNIPTFYLKHHQVNAQLLQSKQWRHTKRACCPTISVDITEWKFADSSGNQLLINFKHLIGVKIFKMLLCLNGNLFVLVRYCWSSGMWLVKEPLSMVWSFKWECPALFSLFFSICCSFLKDGIFVEFWEKEYSGKSREGPRESGCPPYLKAGMSLIFQVAR